MTNETTLKTVVKQKFQSLNQFLIVIGVYHLVAYPYTLLHESKQ